MPQPVFSSGATFLLVCAKHQGISKKYLRVFINERFQILIWGLFFIILALCQIVWEIAKLYKQALRCLFFQLVKTVFINRMRFLKFLKVLKPNAQRLIANSIDGRFLNKNWYFLTKGSGSIQVSSPSIRLKKASESLFLKCPIANCNICQASYNTESQLINCSTNCRLDVHLRKERE